MKLISTLVLLICLINDGSAQNEVQSPHGGQLKSAGYYRMEVVDCSGYLEIYLYGMDMRLILNRDLKGQVDLHYPDSTCMTVPLFPYGTDSFTATPERPSYTGCEVFIRGRNFSVQAKFDDLVCRKPDE